MPVDNLVLHGPIQYMPVWLAIGCGLLLVVAIWYTFLFWFTRKRQIKTIAELPPGDLALDLAALKLKYLKLIDECYLSYTNGQADLRGLHRGLSMIVRYFVYDVRHFPAPRLTLSDLKQAPYPALTKVIEDYYAKEFAMIEHGDPAQAVQIAKGMVEQWV